MCKSATFVWLPVVVALAACNGDPNSPGGTGSLSLQLAMNGALTHDDVTGFLYQIFDASGALVGEKFVPLEEEALPDFILPNIGAGHAFADAFFLLPPGTYTFVAQPMQDATTPSDICQPAVGQAEVVPGETTEVVVISQCEGVDNGGLDIITVLNHPPELTELVYDPSKFAGSCEEVCIEVDADDPDGDPLVFHFEVIDAPPGADYELEVDDNTACLVAVDDGTYLLRVTVEDPLEATTQLSFPVHVSGAGEGCFECIDYATCEPYLSTEPCPPPPEEVCDLIDNDCDGEIDESDPQLGEPCNVGQICLAGVLVCEEGALVCETTPIPNDLDGDGIPDDQDDDDDGDGIPDVSDEFPRRLVVADYTIGFDQHPVETRPIADGEAIADQWASFGVQFTPGFYASRRQLAFPCYETDSTLNVLCTIIGSGDNSYCSLPSAQVLQASTDPIFDFASIEFRTSCLLEDVDQAVLRAFDQAGNAIGESIVVADNRQVPTAEAMARAEVRADSIASLDADPDWFDSIDTLRLVDLERPCQDQQDPGSH